MPWTPYALSVWDKRGGTPIDTMFAALKNSVVRQEVERATRMCHDLMGPDAQAALKHLVETCARGTSVLKRDPVHWLMLVDTSSKWSIQQRWYMIIWLVVATGALPDAVVSYLLAARRTNSAESFTDMGETFRCMAKNELGAKYPLMKIYVPDAENLKDVGQVQSWLQPVPGSERVQKVFKLIQLLPCPDFYTQRDLMLASSRLMHFSGKTRFIRSVGDMLDTGLVTIVPNPGAVERDVLELRTNQKLYEALAAVEAKNVEVYGNACPFLCNVCKANLPILLKEPFCKEIYASATECGIVSHIREDHRWPPELAVVRGMSYILTQGSLHPTFPRSPKQETREVLAAKTFQMGPPISNFVDILAAPSPELRLGLNPEISTPAPDRRWPPQLGLGSSDDRQQFSDERAHIQAMEYMASGSWAADLRARGI